MVLFRVGGVHEVRSFTTRPAVAGLECTEKLERKEKEFYSVASPFVDWDTV